MDLTSTPDTDPPADSNAAQPSTDPAGSRPTMFKCPMCPAIFLSQQGLTQHQVVHRTPRTTATSSDTQTRRGRPPGKDTIQTRLAETVTTEIPIPLSEFTCPLCLEVIGRKGLAQHNASGWQTRVVLLQASQAGTWCRDVYAAFIVHHSPCRVHFRTTLAGEHVHSWSFNGSKTNTIIHPYRPSCKMPHLCEDGPQIRSLWPWDSRQQAKPRIALTCCTTSTCHYINRLHLFQKARLHWYAQTAHWTCHFRSLPQVLMTSDTLFTVVAWIIAIGGPRLTLWLTRIRINSWFSSCIDGARTRVSPWPCPHSSW